MKEQPRFKAWLRPTRTRTILLGIACALALGLLTSRTSPVGVFASDPPEENGSRTPEDEAMHRLRTARQAIWLYRRDHGGVHPPISELTDSWPGLTEQAVGDDGFVFGPYLDQAPQNPFNRSTTVARVGTATPDDGWEYNPMTGELRLVIPHSGAAEARDFPQGYVVLAKRR